MKFGKRLASQMEETLPEWRDKFLSYKQLKKRLKLMSAPDCFTQAAFESSSTSPARDGTSAVDVAVDELKRSAGATKSLDLNASSEGEAVAAAVQGREADEEESEFTSLLEVELEKFNNFFMEKEEEYVIRLQELKDRIESLKSKPGNASDMDHQQELIQIRTDIVTFHGEMVLLFNYSSLNYTGLVKILKKYDKRTGMSLRLPFIQRVLHQPFFTTELLSKLVEECEKNLHSIFPAHEDLVKPADLRQAEPHECEEQVEGIYRSTMAALQTIKDLRKGSSTYSALSLPPLAN